MRTSIINSANKLFVSAYKLVGFAVLTALLVGIFGYLGTGLFFLFDREWIAPLVLSPNSEKVLQMNAHMVQQQYRREQLEAERLAFETQVGTVERNIAANKLLLTRYDTALTASLGAKGRELEKLEEVFKGYQATQSIINDSTAQIIKLTARNSEEELQAKLISEETYVRGKSLVSNNLANQLSYAQREVEFETRLEALRREVGAMRGALAEMRGESVEENVSAQSMDVLLRMRDFHRARLELEDLKAQRLPLQRKLQAIDTSMAEHDEILATIQNSAYYLAMHEQITVAFVPYENLHNVAPGVDVYGCKLELIWCTQVGKVVRILDGEVATRHPLFNRERRGLIVQIKLDDPEWAELKSLHAASKPFLI